MKAQLVAVSVVLIAGGCVTLPTIAAENFICPATITVEEVVSESYPSWEVVQNPQGHHFTRVSFYSGHPREMASLVPDRQNENSNVWEFPGKASESFWLACEYTNTEMMLVQQLRAGFSACEVVYANQLIDSITCR